MTNDRSQLREEYDRGYRDGVQAGFGGRGAGTIDGARRFQDQSWYRPEGVTYVKPGDVGSLADFDHD